MTPYEAIQKMNAGYRYALLNIKKNVVVSVHKEYDKAWSKVKDKAFYARAELRRKECQKNGLTWLGMHDNEITHDVVSLYDIAFN